MQLYLVIATLVGLRATSTEGLRTARLSETDYAVDDDAPFLRILVTTEGGPFTLQIHPLTFSMYQSGQIPGLPACDLTLPSGENLADDTDFDTTIIERDVEPTSLGTPQEFEFNIPITLDSKLEGDEVFLVLLNVTSTEEVGVPRRCAVARIEGTSFANQEVVRMDPPVGDLELPEHAGTVFLFNITKIVETELTIDIKIVVRDAEIGDDIAILPSTTLEITPEASAVSVYMDVIDDLLAEDSESTEIQVTASVTSTPILQQLQTKVTIHDNEVVMLGFVGEEECVIEGSPVTICARLMNIAVDDFLRFDDAFPVSTEDGNATAGVDYIALTSRYVGFFGSQCFNLQTIDNDLVNKPKYFMFNFQSGFTDDLTVIKPSSFQVVLKDNDAPPPTPIIDSVTANTTLTVTWTAEPTPTQRIERFVVIITVGDRLTEFNVSDTIRNFTLQEYKEEETHIVVVCAESMNGRTCSTPRTVEPSIVETTPPIITPRRLPNRPSRVSPGLVAGIAVIVGVTFWCCLLLLLLCLCLRWKMDRERSYWPAKSEAKELKSASPDSNYSYEEDIDLYSYELDMQKAPL